MVERCFTKKAEDPNGGFPKLGVPFLGVARIRTSILGSILGSPDFGNVS